jgi:CsoR family transcriptional regulator, copper-sensing transcriptional repressor
VQCTRLAKRLFAHRGVFGRRLGKAQACIGSEIVQERHVTAGDGGAAEPAPCFAAGGQNLGGRPELMRRIEGQVRGRQRMVEDDKYCIDILTQVAATTRALQSVALGLFEEHLGHCVAGAVAEGGDAAAAKVKEASDAIARLVKS